MDVGVGLPATIPGVDGRRILDWARRADDGPFSTLGIIDRIAYPNHEPIATLAAAAAVTSRIRLTTTVLVAPIRNTGLLAKQAASIDSLSGGRLTLGLGIGGREEDYLAAGSGAPFSERAARFEDQLEAMRRIWRGEPPRDGVNPIGPRPVSEDGPTILIGGYSEPAARRAGRVGDGFLGGNLPPPRARELYDVAVGAWEEAGREGRPTFVGCAYWSLGDEATVERGRDFLRDYYGFGGEQRAEQAASNVLVGEDAIRERLDAAREVGMDEYVLWPTVWDLDRLDDLAELVTAWRGS